MSKELYEKEVKWRKKPKYGEIALFSAGMVMLLFMFWCLMLQSPSITIMSGIFTLCLAFAVKNFIKSLGSERRVYFRRLK